MSLFNWKKKEDREEPKPQAPAKSAEELFAEGMECVKQKDFAGAAEKFRAAAEPGFPPAQYNLGICFLNGNGVDKDPVQAVKWFALSAEKGYASAMVALASAYTQGTGGLPQSYTKAAEWLYKASAQGNAKAKEVLEKFRASGLAAPDITEEEHGKLVERVKNHDVEALFLEALCARDGMGRAKSEYEYYRGILLCEHNKYEPSYRLFRELDAKKLLEYGHRTGGRLKTLFYNEAIKRGEPEAWRHLGTVFHMGEEPDISPDLDKAVRCYESGYEKGDIECAEALGELYMEDNAKTDIDKAVAWLKRGAEKGSEGAMIDLGVIFWVEKYGRRDPGQVVYWLKRAVEAGSAEAMFRLASVYRNPTSGPYRDAAKAAAMARKGAEAGSTGAMILLGYFYETGNGVEQNRGKAEELYLQAAAKGDTSGLQAAGELLLASKNASPAEKRRAIEYYRSGAEGGHAGCMYYYAEAFKTGEVIHQDDGKYIYWLTRAAEEKDLDSVFNLAVIFREGSYGVSPDRSRSEDLFRSILGKIQEEAGEYDETGKYHYLMALMYKNGYAVEKDSRKAFNFNSYARDKGYKPAYALESELWKEVSERLKKQLEK